jgi:adenine specific DNA methylase Mod
MYTLYNNDCINLQLKNIKLIYLDPPFGSKKEDKFYGITETFEEYLSYMEARLQKLASFMDPKGSNILLHVDQKAVHYLKVIMDKIWGRANFRNHIVWCYTGPSVVKSYLPRKHDDILWYSTGEKYPFNQEMTEYQGKLKVGGNTSWNPDKKGSENEYLARGKKLEDWWIDIPSLCSNEI